MIGSIVRFVRRLASRDSAQVAVWIGAGGLALMVGNLVLAGVLPAEDFGRLTLVEAILSVGVGIGPLGHDSLVVRREVPQRWESILLIGTGSLGLSALAGGVTYLLYEIGIVGSVLVSVGCLGGAVGLLCAAFDRADMNLNRAQAVSQLPFLAFAVGALVLWAVGDRAWLHSAAAIVGGYVLSGAVGLVLFQYRRHGADDIEAERDQQSWRDRWRKAFTFLGIVASGFILNQIERFIIPRALDLEELAVYGVAATLVLGPYKLLQGGIGYALMPRLTSTGDTRHRRSLVQRELQFAAGSSLAVGMCALVAVPFVVELLYADKYAVGVWLVAAVALVGGLRAFYGAVAATLKALGDEAQLHKYNVTGWASILVALGGGFGLAWGGLVGVTLGVSLGWAVRTLVVGLLSRRAIGNQEAQSEASEPTEQVPA